MSIGKFTTFGALLAASTALTGCLKPGSVLDAGATAALIYDTRAEARNLPMTNTTMPDTGGASYEGYAAGMIKDTDFDGSGMPTQIGRHFVGDAAFDVTFASNNASFSGEITNILAKDDVDQNDAYSAYFSGSADDIEAFLSTFDTTSGSIRFTNGKLAPTSNSPTAVTADIDGGFTHGSDKLDFGGTAIGYFAGTDGEVLFVNAETHEGLTITENGTPRYGDIGSTAVDTSN